jgi:hypothetical protein
MTEKQTVDWTQVTRRKFLTELLRHPLITIEAVQRESRRSEGAVKARVLERDSNYVQSRANGTLFTLEELARLISTILKDLENTRRYKLTGYVGFYLDTVGMDFGWNTFKFNPKAKTLQTMFKPVTEADYDALPFNERARFWSGEQPLYVGLRRDPCGYYGRLDVNGNDSPLATASVVVVNQAGNPAVGAKAANSGEEDWHVGTA